MILEASGVSRYFLEIAGPDEKTPTKPDPAMLRALMRAADASPGETVVVGDMEVDSEFARAAGCRVVLVPGGSRAREDLERVRRGRPSRSACAGAVPPGSSRIPASEVVCPRH